MSFVISDYTVKMLWATYHIHHSTFKYPFSSPKSSPSHKYCIAANIQRCSYDNVWNNLGF